MHTKLLSLPELTAALAAPRATGKRIVFTNGCFDLLHAGHVRYLAAAKAAGDILVVGLNSDGSMKKIKGPRRPLVPQALRAEVLAALTAVDYIVIFEEPDPLRLITALAPDVLVKGADWEEKDIVGADQVKAGGGRVERISLVSGISTSELIRRIKERYC